MVQPTPSHLHALVDMGSNGVRFSITNLAPDTARSLPVVFQERLGISLYEAQHSTGAKVPIPQNVIDSIVTGLKRFKVVCTDFAVPDDKITVLATEATRSALNSEDFRQQIKSATEWEVKLLSRAEEGKIGALGIASSYESVAGLVMDLGGGSTQLTWMIFENGSLTVSSKGAISFPYGAAAMNHLLSQIDDKKHAIKSRTDLKTTVKQQYIQALDELKLPSYLKEKIKSRNMTLYLSGGGFRGWGYIVMSKARKGPYPIPIINGFHALVRDFSNIDTMKEAAEHEDHIFRISKRRAKQVPAVAFLVDAIIEAYPFITDVRFCQGGVREGYLFDTLSNSTKSLSPLVSATSPYTIDSASASHLATILKSSLPSNGHIYDRSYPSSFTASLLHALANTMYIHSAAPKESASLSALYLPITGALASAHGLSHANRALLGLSLCHRHHGDLPPPHTDFQARIQSLLTSQEVWWTKYLGAIAALVGDTYPAGRVVGSTKPRIELSARWADGLGKKGNQQGVVLGVNLQKGDAEVLGEELLAEHVERIEGLGKKKNRVGGEYGFGVLVRVDVELR